MTTQPSVPLRPKMFERVIFDSRPGMGQWVRDLFADEQAGLRDDLEKTTDPEAIERIKTEIVWSIDLLRDIDEAMLGMPPRRMRLFRGGSGEWVQEVLRAEQAVLYEDLAKLRGEGRKEDDPEVAQTVNQLYWSINLLRDVDAALVNLVGPNEDPR